MHLINCFLSTLALATSCDAISTSLNGRREIVGRSYWDDSAEIGSLSSKDDTDPRLLYPAYTFSVPVDHFHNESRYEPHRNDKYNMRYWFDATFFEPGGPVIILQGGETDGAGRLPFLQKGLLHELAAATNGIGVVMEHRYYGDSFPVSDLSNENLRFLTTEQAMADAAYFAENIQFPGLEKYGDLTSRTTAYLGYGGSYAGAFNAFLRVQYPDVFWGTISSSGVTEAIYDYWQYFAPIAEYGPADCMTAQKTFTHIVDNIVIGKNDSDLTTELKSLLGLQNLTHIEDFANVLSTPLGAWQALNWDPSVSSSTFYRYCANITASEVLYPATEPLRSSASHLISEGGYEINTSFVNQLLNYVGYLNTTVVSKCEEGSQDECFSNFRPNAYENRSLEHYPRLSWLYQTCIEWGYYMPGSTVPEDQLPLISRVLDLAYETLPCRLAFDIANPSDVDRINKYGGYNISSPRLAFIDGEWDPWRPATPHGFGYGAHDRANTASEPFIMIPRAVHHWDENSVFENQTSATFPPHRIVDTQKAEIQFVQEWMEEWKLTCRAQGSCAKQDL